jgi:hypothetical protein
MEEDRRLFDTVEQNILLRLLDDEWLDINRDREKAQPGSRKEQTLAAYQATLEKIQAKLR